MITYRPFYPPNPHPHSLTPPSCYFFGVVNFTGLFVRYICCWLQTDHTLLRAPPPLPPFPIGPLSFHALLPLASIDGPRTNPVPSPFPFHPVPCAPESPPSILVMLSSGSRVETCGSLFSFPLCLFPPLVSFFFSGRLRL